MTNREFFEKVIATVSDDELVAKATEEIAKLDKRNADRKGKESKKALENKPIIEALAKALTDEPKLASDLATEVGISVSKASALLKKIEGVNITDVKVKGKGVRKAYSL